MPPPAAAHARDARAPPPRAATRWAPRPTASRQRRGPVAANARSPEESRASLLQALGDALTSQKWLDDIARPWTAGPPRPVVDTVPPRALADLDSHFAQVQGIKVHYKARMPAADNTASVSCATLDEDDGLGAALSDDDPIVLCFHGFNGSEFSFRHLLPAVASDKDVHAVGVAFDRPPFGLTERPRDNDPDAERLYSVPGSSDIGRQLLRHVLGDKAQGKRTRVVLVGHSAGAPCAVRTALDLVDDDDFEVAGMVLVAPALNLAGSGGAGDDAETTSALPSKFDAGQLLRFAYARALLAVPGVNANFVRQSLLERRERAWRDRDVYSEAKGKTPMEVVMGYTKPLAADGWDTGALPYFRNNDFTSAEANPDPAALPPSTPVLVVHGSEDGTVAPAVGRGVCDRLRANGFADVEYAELKGIGHLPMETDPEPFLGAVMPFLRRYLHRDS